VAAENVADPLVLREIYIHLVNGYPASFAVCHWELLYISAGYDDYPKAHFKQPGQRAKRCFREPVAGEVCPWLALGGDLSAAAGQVYGSVGAQLITRQSVARLGWWPAKSTEIGSFFTTSSHSTTYYILVADQVCGASMRIAAGQSRYDTNRVEAPI